MKIKEEVTDMSLENVDNLFYRMDHEFDVKEKVDNIVAKYSSPEYENINREEIIMNELIPLGKEIGLEFTCEEFARYLSDPSLQRLYETARVVGGSPDSPDFGKRIAANVAQKSIMRSAIGSAESYYQNNYVSDEEFGDYGNIENKGK